MPREHDYPGDGFPICSSPVETWPHRLRYLGLATGLGTAIVLACGANTDGTHINPSFSDHAVTLPAKPETDKILPLSLPTRVEQEITKYLTHDIGRLFDYSAKSWFVVISPEPVIMRVTTQEGIILRDFPDVIASRRIPTQGPGNGPTIKAFYTGDKIPGIHYVFIRQFDQRAQIMTIWGARFSNEGGWPQSVHPQPHLETWRVYDSADPKKWFFSFETEDGPISGDELFSRAWPVPLFAPPFRGVLPDGSINYGKGTIGPSIADQQSVNGK